MEFENTDLNIDFNTCYNKIYYVLKDYLLTEYQDKQGRIVFSEQMPKEYFNSDISYNGEEHGYYERDLDEIESFDKFSLQLLKKVIV